MGVEIITISKTTGRKPSKFRLALTQAANDGFGVTGARDGWTTLIHQQSGEYIAIRQKDGARRQVVGNVIQYAR